jgi:hypothetical protein
MIDVEMFYYVKSDTRLVRFSKKVELSAVPFTGSDIRIKGDILKVGEVTFIDGGGVEVIIDNEHEDDQNVRPDSELDDFIEEMKDEYGWKLESNVKRRK